MKLFTLPPPDISTLNVAVTCKTRVSLFFLQDEAIYFVAGTDDDGDPLMANQEYEVVLVATTRLPARWWSITAYGKDHFLIKNRLNKFSVNVRNVESGCGGALIMVCEQHGSGDVDEARGLIAQGINIDEQDYRGMTALLYAAVWNRVEIVKELVRAGASLNWQDAYGKSAVIYAAEKNRLEVVQELVGAGATLDEDDLSGWTAIEYGQEYGHSEIVALLAKATGASS